MRLLGKSFKCESVSYILKDAFCAYTQATHQIEQCLQDVRCIYIYIWNGFLDRPLVPNQCLLWCSISTQHAIFSKVTWHMVVTSHILNLSFLNSAWYTFLTIQFLSCCQLTHAILQQAIGMPTPTHALNVLCDSPAKQVADAKELFDTPTIDTPTACTHELLVLMHWHAWLFLVIPPVLKIWCVVLAFPQSLHSCKSEYCPLQSIAF